MKEGGEFNKRILLALIVAFCVSAVLTDGADSKLNLTGDVDVKVRLYDCSSINNNYFKKSVVNGSMCVAVDYYKFFTVGKFNQICQKERPQKIGKRKLVLISIILIIYINRI